jgi:hypothetical protein
MARDLRIGALAAVGGAGYLLLTAVRHMADSAWIDVARLVAAGIPFLAIVWLLVRRARREPRYAKELKLKNALFVAWLALALATLFIVPKPWAWLVIVTLVALLWLLAELAKRLARSR